MKLEDEIKQKKFKNEYQKMLVNILYTSNWIVAIHEKSLKKYGISPEQYNILRILRGQYPNPATVNLLMERMLNKMSNASRLVEKLRRKNLVERKTSKSDRRACDVFIVKKGLKLLSELDAEENNWIAGVSVLSEKEAVRLNYLLDKLRNSSENYKLTTNN